jgi:virginiamycin B lyase
VNKTLAAVLAAVPLLAAPAAQAIRITEFAIPAVDAAPQGVALGPDGRIWFADTLGKRVGAVTTDGTFMLFPVTGLPIVPAAIPGRALVFPEQSPSGLGFVSVDGTHFDSPGLTLPLWAAFGPDGRIWITEQGSNVVTALHYLSNSPPTDTRTLSGGAWNVAVGPDGRMWITEIFDSKVAACAVGGTCDEYPLPAGSQPTGIAAGPDGNLWIAEYGTGKIARMATTGAYTEFPIPTPGGGAYGICAGPDGNLWFVEFQTSKIGRITKSGVITEWPTPTSHSYPYGIALGADGSLWFSESQTHAIGRVEPFVPGDVNGDGDVSVNDVFYLINFLFASGAAPQ